ncbi:MAG: hypothetical protein IJ635_10520 [Bacteroidaceae bacterium]|nr:hypothetical protein [Bacteroidaceae bacterium]
MKRLHTTQEVEQLLARFMDGTSTLEEEAQLAESFRTHEVAGEWKEYKKMFALFDKGEVEVKQTQPRWRKYIGMAATMALLVGIGSFLWIHQGSPKRQSLTAKVDTVKTSPQQMEEKDNRVEEEKKDTNNVVKDAERVIYSTPKVYMAKASAPSITTEPHQDTETAEAELSPEEYVEWLIAENKARMNAMMAAEDPYELREEIRRRGERLTQSIEMAISNDNY